MTVQVKVKEIDFKSLLIGFLLATVVFLLIGAGPASSGTQDVRIVDVYTSDVLNVKIKDVDSYVKVPVKMENEPVKVKIDSVDSYIEVPVIIKDQPIKVSNSRY